jgi:hypothetical protein
MTEKNALCSMNVEASAPAAVLASRVMRFDIVADTTPRATAVWRFFVQQNVVPFVNARNNYRCDEEEAEGE